MSKTTTHRLADMLLGRPLAEYVESKRAEGVSWRRISIQLRDDTSGEIDVTYETLRAWFPDEAKAAS